MINHRQSLLRLVLATLSGFVAFHDAHGQTPPAVAPPPAEPSGSPPASGAPEAAAAPVAAQAGPPATPPTAPAAPSSAATAPLVPPPEEVPPGEAGSGAMSGQEIAKMHRENLGSLVFPTSTAAVKRRKKLLRPTVSLDPAAPDFGAEADLVSTANEGTANIKPKRWTFTMHGYLRAPLSVGIGPSPTLSSTDTPAEANELHSPANHIVGADNTSWNSVGLKPSSMSALYLSVGNAVVSGTMIVTAGTFYDVGYKKLEDMGTISQAYVTMKFHDAFGGYGGLAVTGGAFSNRYGMAGPHGNSSGYYNTYVFGRTRVAGAAVTADLDLTDHLELVIESGGGAKLEVIPWLPKAPTAPYLPDQGPTPQGSNFVHHHHAQLLVDDWLQVAAHYMQSWTPNDLSATNVRDAFPRSSQMKVMGGEAHLDHPRYGNAYVGYSHISADAVLSLADGIEVLHSTNGTGLTRNYLNPGFVQDYPDPNVPNDTVTAVAPGSQGDSGKIDSVVFQYMLRLAPLLDLPATGRDLTLAVFGMFNHVTSNMLVGGKQDKFKFGAEAQFAPWKYLSLGARFDRVMANGGSSDDAYTAISPRLIFHSSWLSREYFLISYTRYFLGANFDQRILDLTYQGNYTSDKNLLLFSAQIAF